jgi:hypothetical protein
VQGVAGKQNDSKIAHKILESLYPFANPSEQARIHAILTPIHAILTLIHAILTPIHAILTLIHAISTPIHAILTLIHAISTPIHSGALPACQQDGNKTHSGGRINLYVTGELRERTRLAACGRD